jgi:hypothetical protein
MFKSFSLLLLVLTLFVNPSFATTHIKIKLINLKVILTKKTPSTEWLFKLPDPLPSSIRQLIWVSFSSSQDLRHIAKMGNLNIYPIAKICGEEVVFDKADENLAFSEILDPHGRIKLSAGKKVRMPVVGQNFYHVYLATISTPNSQLPVNFSYDFSKRPKDICFSLGGGSMWGGKKLDSNILSISADRIMNAFHAPEQ